MRTNGIKTDNRDLMVCDRTSGETIPNIALMLQKNAELFRDKIVFREKRNDQYLEITWGEFYKDIRNITSNLKEIGFGIGDKMVIFSKNSLEMLEIELAVMSMGAVAVPVFFNYSSESVQSLIVHSDSTYLTVGSHDQLKKISPELELKYTFIIDPLKNSEFDLEKKARKRFSQFSELLKEKDSFPPMNFNAHPEDICLNMYTSGTMGNEKCVLLSHKNILSQQSAIQSILNIDSNDRFLSYLRWHHSFGGIFEMFSCLYNGASMTLESSFGTNPSEILENWKVIKPTVFFSVPLIYQALIDIISGDKELEEQFFHPELKFVFTAAAPLPKRISDEFEKRGVPVIEGYGLTETSPCCTLTNPKEKRQPGVVGFPIPNVTIKLAEDGEILVKGPNVMAGYYKNDAENEKSFTADGWYCTGDIGEITETGLRLITRKDRIFKLLNAEKIIPTKIEGNIIKKCPYISYVLVEGQGRSYPVALLFPNHGLLNKNNLNEKDFIGCSCPEDVKKLSGCLCQCLKELNRRMNKKFSRVKAALLIDDKLSVENKTLTPSLKLAPNKVREFYKSHIEELYGGKIKTSGNVYLLKLDE